MVKDDPQTELIAYIRELDSSEQISLLKQLKLRKALAEARALDKKLRVKNKGKKLITDDEIAAIVRGIRKRNAKSST